jgi:hypothetical protein
MATRNWRNMNKRLDPKDGKVKYLIASLLFCTLHNQTQSSSHLPTRFNLSPTRFIGTSLSSQLAGHRFSAPLHLVCGVRTTQLPFYLVCTTSPTSLCFARSTRIHIVTITKLTTSKTFLLHWNHRLITHHHSSSSLSAASYFSSLIRRIPSSLIFSLGNLFDNIVNLLLERRPRICEFEHVRASTTRPTEKCTDRVC